MPDLQAPTSTKNPKENRPAIRESQVEGICGDMRQSAAVGFLWGIWRGFGWGGRDWVVLWELGGATAVVRGVRNLSVL